MRRAAVWAAVLALALTACDFPTPLASPPVSETPSPTAPPNDPLVYTDWSQLGDRPVREPDLYDRWHGAFTDHLIPSPDYGPLIPFGGVNLDDDWGFGGYTLDGLMTLEGKVVVDPVYALVTRLGWGGDFDWYGMDGYHPAYLLSQYAGDGTGDLFGATDDVRSVLCAADGSWVTEKEYRFGYEAQSYGHVPENGGLFGLRDGSVLALLDVTTGKETFAVTLDGLSDEDLSAVLNNAAYGDGRVTTRTSNYENGVERAPTLYCWDLDGNKIPLPAGVSELSYDGFSDGLCPARQSGTGLWGYLDVSGAWAIQPQFDTAWSFADGVARARPADRSVDTLLIDKTGRSLHSGVPVYDHVQRSGDYWFFSGYSGDVGLVLDKYGKEVPSPLLHSGEVTVLDRGWAVMELPDGAQLLARGTESWVIPAGWESLWYRNLTEDTVCLNYYGFSAEYAPGDSRYRWAMWRPRDGDAPSLYDPQVRLGYSDGPSLDPVTGETYFAVVNVDETYTVLDPGGKPLFENLPGWPQLWGGRCLYTETVGSAQRLTLLSPQGKVLFRKTLMADD